MSIEKQSNLIKNPTSMLLALLGTLGLTLANLTPAQAANLSPETKFGSNPISAKVAAKEQPPKRGDGRTDPKNHEPKK